MAAPSKAMKNITSPIPDARDLSASTGDERWTAKFTVLKETVEHHVRRRKAKSGLRPGRSLTKPGAGAR